MSAKLFGGTAVSPPLQIVGPDASAIMQSLPNETVVLLEPSSELHNLTLGLTPIATTILGPLDLRMEVASVRPICQNDAAAFFEINDSIDACHLFLATTRTSDPLEFREFEVKTPEDKEKFRCEGDGCFCLLKGLTAYCVEHVEDDVDTPFCSYFCSAAHRKETVEEWRRVAQLA